MPRHRSPPAALMNGEKNLSHCQGDGAFPRRDGADIGGPDRRACAPGSRRRIPRRKFSLMKCRDIRGPVYIAGQVFRGLDRRACTPGYGAESRGDGFPLKRCRNIGYRPFGPVPREAAHNSAVLLCRLRCTSRADQVVLHPI